jgi:hypothetical protein
VSENVPVAPAEIVTTWESTDPQLIGHEGYVTTRRTEAMAWLLDHQALSYVRLLGDPPGRHWVAVDGALLGRVETPTPSVALGEWYAHPLDGGQPLGPFRYLRAAAAALKRRGVGDTPGEKEDAEAAIHQYP